MGSGIAVGGAVEVAIPGNKLNSSPKEDADCPSVVVINNGKLGIETETEPLANPLLKPKPSTPALARNEANIRISHEESRKQA